VVGYRDGESGGHDTVGVKYVQPRGSYFLQVSTNKGVGTGGNRSHMKHFIEPICFTNHVNGMTLVVMMVILMRK